MSRYHDKSKTTIYERDKILGKFVKKRNRTKMVCFSTPQFFKLEKEDLKRLTTVKHVWTARDTYWKLAHQHYGDANMWYMIALFNEKPTEANLNVGDIVYVPFPIEDVVEIYS
jgi:nucleoid-associated protein YgaU